MLQFRDKKQIAKKQKLIKNFIFLVFFLLLAVGGVFASTSGALHFIGRPIWKVEQSILQGINDSGYILRTKSSIYKENENILKENTDLKIKMLDYTILKNENLKLKELFDRTPLTKDLILGNILTKPNFSPYDTIIIDIGDNSSVSIGDIVYSESEVPIGEVSAVYGDTSLITLYSNPGELTEAVIDVSNTSVELIGRGGGNFEMTIPVDLPFTKGTFVFLPNFKSEVVAIIQEVISSPNDPVKKILLNSPINVQSLKWVFVKRN